MYATGQTAQVLEDVNAARERQVEKGYTPEHDDAHGWQLLTNWGAWRALDGLNLVDLTPEQRREALVDAAALLVAAIEVIDRA